MDLSFPSDQPYLSVIATARNDDHGANLLRRLQTFVNALFGQAERHEVCLELVLVEWNPPPEKPPLAEALRWPQNSAFCRTRIITVPPEVHGRFRHSATLPLYQMIAKNVGIRRAAGEFILATNIDILFSTELMEFLAARRLEPGRMYRVNRHDADAGVPVDGTIVERLAYCREHVLRVHEREGSRAPAGNGADTPDIATRASGISFGAGWGAAEQHFGRVRRAGAGTLEVLVQPAAVHRTLLLELEPSAGAASSHPQISLLDPRAGRETGAVPIIKRSVVKVGVPSHAAAVRLRASAGQCGVGPLVLAVRCEWAGTAPHPAVPIEVEPAPWRPQTRCREFTAGLARFLSDLRRGNGSGRIGLPLPRQLASRLTVGPAGVSIGLRSETGENGEAALRLPPPIRLHTNACGDFTLAHRSHWFELRGYPELDLFSMNLDSVFCYMAHFGGAPEQILPEPMRVYHIEHATGSGWTPEGQHLLYRRLAEKGIPWLSNEEVLHWASQMERWNNALILNRANWGLAEFTLPEVTPMEK